MSEAVKVCKSRVYLCLLYNLSTHLRPLVSYSTTTSIMLIYFTSTPGYLLFHIIPRIFQVVVRCRPPNSKEKRENRGTIVKVDPAIGSILITNPDDPAADPKQYTYDSTYDENSTQQQVYEDVGM